MELSRRQRRRVDRVFCQSQESLREHIATLEFAISVLTSDQPPPQVTSNMPRLIRDAIDLRNCGNILQRAEAVRRAEEQLADFKQRVDAREDQHHIAVHGRLPA